MDLQEFTKVAISEKMLLRMTNKGLLQRIPKLLTSPIKTIRGTAKQLQRIGKKATTGKRLARFQKERSGSVVGRLKTRVQSRLLREKKLLELQGKLGPRLIKGRG